MSSSGHFDSSEGRAPIDRRNWLGRVITLGSGLVYAHGTAPGVAAQDPMISPVEEAEQELERATARARTATSRPLLTLRTEQYQAVGDAAESFMKITLGDCENIARDFLGYYQGQGFEVRRPGRRLTAVVFLDERPYLEFARRFVPGVTVYAWGFYSRRENWLVLFDFRNVPLNERNAAFKNVKTLAHEGTHQLTYNTGLLNRRGDAPRAVVEGLASYGETRPLHGRGEPGQVNGTRLDDLAHIRRRVRWISATELLTDDSATFGNTLDQTLLAYAQGWLLVYYLMKTPARLPQFQAYLKTISTRADRTHRYDDAEKHFGDLDRLDQELQREAVRLQRMPRP
jgi:hypothetical protein